MCVQLIGAPALDQSPRTTSPAAVRQPVPLSGEAAAQHDNAVCASPSAAQRQVARMVPGNGHSAKRSAPIPTRKTGARSVGERSRYVADLDGYVRWPALS